LVSIDFFTVPSATFQILFVFVVLAYYQRSRTHFSLDKDAPDARDVQPPPMGKVVELPQVGGLHHRYERRAA